ncbi:autotransporter domain-containing SGNH/GDSL hydrolase family protein [Maricurvus nonylphenolicus]|uniref:autotransporter domain-containing protein n=1 Tax=Maricurvus nonylphenolicus TaxID=1008307 RepID=UPI0036F28C24
MPRETEKLCARPKTSKFAKTKLHCAIALSCAIASAPTMAAPYSELIVFGDSLLDSGQFPNPGAPGTGLRFTNTDGSGVFEQVAVQHLAESLGLGNLGPSTPSDTAVTVGTNYAVGGYTTDQILASITDPNGSVVDATGFGGGITTRNGYLVDNPTIDANALIFIDGGGNDILQGDVTDATTAAAAANNLKVGIEALADAGANYIMYANTPSFDLTPLAAAMEAASPGSSAGLQALGNLLEQTVYATLRETNANIIPVDMGGLVEEILQDPDAYGFDSSLGSELYTTCYNASASPLTTCTENTTYGISSANPDPSKLLYNDDVHPTAALHNIMGDFYASILQAPAEVSMLPRMATNAVSNNITRLQQQLRVAPTGDSSAIGTWQLLTNLESSEIKYRDNFSSADGEQNRDIGSIGLRYTIDHHWSSGVMLDIFNDEWENDTSEYPMKGFGVTAFGQYRSQTWQVDMMAGIADFDFNDLERGIQLGQHLRTETGNTDGFAYSLASEVGYNLAPEIGQWAYGPRVNLRYIRSEVEGYSEKSGSSTSLKYEDQVQESLTSEWGMFLRFVTADAKLTINTEVGLRHEHIDSDEMVRMTALSLDLNSYELPGSQQDADDEVTASVSASYRLTDATALTASYQYVDGDDENKAFNVGLSLRF